MQLLQPSQQTLLVRSPTEGSLQSERRREQIKRRVIYKNLRGEIVDQPNKTPQPSPMPRVVKASSRTITPTPSESCKSQSQTVSVCLLDVVPLDDPLWTDLIPMEIQQDPNFSLEKLVLDNQEYFINLIGLYMQERQQNKIQELKVSLPTRKQTTYDQEFKKMQSIDGSMHFNQKMYESIHPSNSVQMRTQYETSFRKPLLHTLENFKPPFVKDKAEMLFLTSYKQNYMDWKGGKTERMNATKNVSTGSLPFIGKTNYQENFQQTYGEPSESQRKQQLGPFCSNSSMIFKESMNKISYPHHTIEDTPVRKSVSKLQTQNNAYEGSYKTTFKRYIYKSKSSSYNNKQQDPQIQDRYWKQKLVQKIMEKKFAL